MSKRLGNFQNKPQTKKKPKLEISINAHIYAGTSKKIEKPQPQKYESEDLWGDEDDDVILVEKCATIEQHSQHISTNQHQHSFVDISFSQFGNAVQSSTQKPKVDEEVINLLEDDDDAFSNINDLVCDEMKNTQKDNKAQTFKIPETVSKPLPSVDKSCFTNDPKDIQVNYYVSKVDTLKKENEQLTKCMAEFNEKILTKDGEVSTLRHELRHLKQQNEKLRLEKMQENDSTKMEFQQRINELEKTITVQRSELMFKKIEINNIKTKNLNESQMMIVEPIEVKKQFHNFQYLQHLHLQLDNRNEYLTLRIPPDIYKKSADSSKKTNFREALFEKQLQNLRCILSQIDSISTTDCTIVNRLTDEIISVSKHTFHELSNYIQSLEFSRFNDTNAKIEYEFLCQDQESSKFCSIHRKKDESIFIEELLFPNEKARNIRRVIGAIAILCSLLKSICDKILAEKINDTPLMEVIINAIDLLGYSKELYNHCGLIEALAIFLYHIVRNSTETKELYNFITRYLKSLIYCRPNRRPLVIITHSLAYLSRASNDVSIINSMCTNSADGSFEINEYYKIFQFSPDSCTLQVYGALLEAAFPQDKILKPSQIDCLSKICYNHCKFLWNCFERDVHWVWKTKDSCDCYVKATTSFVVLLHQFLRQWILNPKSIDIKVVSKIAKIGSCLLCKIFHINYRREVLQNGGSAIKNRLHIIHDWLSDYGSVFKFKTAHYNALQSIKFSHIIADPIRTAAEETGTSSIEIGDQIWQNVFKEFF